MKRAWRIASEDEIKEGKTTDVYFNRTVEILEGENVNPTVHAEFTVSSMPNDHEWGVTAGIDDALKLLEGQGVDVYGLPEGTVFWARGKNGVRTPVIAVEGPYRDFTIMETPILGFLCHTSGMVTKTAHVRLAAGDKLLLSFGARRTHPAITPQVAYAGYIGGCDGVSCVLGGEMLGIEPSGTMPHALIISFQNHRKAWESYDKHVDKDAARVALVDTYLDEVKESIMAAETIQDLDDVRLDTPSSRRGSMERILQEVRWELDTRGFDKVKIFISGGLDADSVRALRDIGADGFGVGGAISNAPAVDFAMDIVSMVSDGEWIPVAKRGKFSGRKRAWRCRDCLRTQSTLIDSEPGNCPVCGGRMEGLTVKLMENGEILHEPKSPNVIRDSVLEQIRRLDQVDR
ncbi:MAG: nicotinate phosphoribosyltransferase [Candidatus Thorarchaeota archaeon]